MCSGSEFIQEFLDLSRSKENELKRGQIKLVLTPQDVSFLQKVVEKAGAYGAAGLGTRLNLILTPNDLETIRNALKNLKSFSVKLRTESAREGKLDFKYFSELEYLELVKVEPSQLTNIDALRPKLKLLKCYQCLKWLKEVLRQSEQKLDNAFWVNLKHLDISYNSLEYFDDSLSLLSRLEVFNASHNKIKSSEGLKLLKDVSYVNLGFNKLTEFPSFNPQTCNSLTRLVLRYNFLQNLGGIQYLMHLSELDVGYNLLESHVVLAHLNELNNLAMLRLEGNPLSFCKKHRVLTAVHLNNSILKSVKLDGHTLSSKEIKESYSVGLRVNKLPFRRPLLIQPDNSETPYFQPEMIGSLNYEGGEDASLISSLNSTENDQQLLVPDEEPIAKAFVKKKKQTKKQSRAREAAAKTERDSPTSKQLLDDDVSRACSSGSHVETKIRVEEARREQGTGWLLSANTILGTTTEQSISGSWKSQKSETESTNNNLKEAPSGQKDATPSSSTESVHRNLVAEDVFLANARQTEMSPLNVASSSTEDEQQSSEDDYGSATDENEFESNLFIVQRNMEGGEERSIVLSVADETFLEKDAFSGKPLHTWNLNTLIDAQEIQEGENVFVQLEFDVVRKDKRDRTYVVDDSETAKALLTLLDKFIEARTLKTMSEELTRCLKCDFEFQSNQADRVLQKINASEMKEVNACPKCKSTFLVIDSEPDNDNNWQREREEPPSSYSSGSRIHSLFQSTNSAKSIEDSGSIGKHSRPRSVSEEMRVAQRKGGGAYSSHLGNETETSSKNCDLSSTSSSSVDCISSKSDQEEDEETRRRSGPGATTCLNGAKLVFDGQSVAARRSESDITVLSNPSQSSIAVISTTSSSLEPQLEVILESPSLGIYDSGSVGNESFYTVATFNSPVAKLKSQRAPTPSAEDSLSRRLSPDETLLLRDVTDENLEEPRTREDGGAKEIWEELREPTTMDGDQFLQLDHRIRLKLEMEFFGDDEELYACVDAQISTSKAANNFQGMAVFSSRMVYLFAPLTSGDSIELTKLTIEPISDLKLVRTLLGSQAVCFKHAGDFGYALNFGDADLCNSFITLIEDVVKSKMKLSQVSFEQSTEKDLSKVKSQVLTMSGDGSSSEIELFLIVNVLGWREQVALVMTENSFNLAQIQYFDKSSSDLTNFLFKEKRAISNLVSLHISPDMKSVGLHFMDEDDEKGAESYWVLETRSKTSLATLLSTLAKHWERLFLIDLQLSIVVTKCPDCGLQPAA